MKEIKDGFESFIVKFAGFVEILCVFIQISPNFIQIFQFSPQISKLLRFSSDFKSASSPNLLNQVGAC